MGLKRGLASCCLINSPISHVLLQNVTIFARHSSIVSFHTYPFYIITVNADGVLLRLQVVATTYQVNSYYNIYYFYPIVDEI